VSQDTGFFTWLARKERRGTQKAQKTAKKTQKNSLGFLSVSSVEFLCFLRYWLLVFSASVFLSESSTNSARHIHCLRFATQITRVQSRIGRHSLNRSHEALGSFRLA
jgi:hypothetical protein